MTDEREKWLAQAVGDPGSVFESPEALAGRNDLSREEKVRILRSWEYDVADLEVATEENMGGGADNDLLRRILVVLAELTDATEGEHVAPSKQHGFTD